MFVGWLLFLSELFVFFQKAAAQVTKLTLSRIECSLRPGKAIPGVRPCFHCETLPPAPSLPALLFKSPGSSFFIHRPCRKEKIVDHRSFFTLVLLPSYLTRIVLNAETFQRFTGDRETGARGPFCVALLPLKIHPLSVPFSVSSICSVFSDYYLWLHGHC
ncbi:hypothetical protein CEXT_533211 [Caerostris extrusa]|uniref:Secreted protein n=1 Tax=Caerostris extrusa TaxID=172846 RepID=A0AAV4MT47_CAEEX|nr:hypothetical protein CEXT_533211 [Caerostris extrusa]